MSSQLYVNPKGQIIRNSSGFEPELVVARPAPAQLTVDEVAYVMALPEQDPLRIAYLASQQAQSPVSGDTVLVAESRTALPSDSGQTLELAASVTYTLSGAVPLPGGVVLMGPASGSATRAVTAGATVGGSTDSATIDARALVALIPRASDATAYEQAGGA
jgi:hypothetical protein